MQAQTTADAHPHRDHVLRAITDDDNFRVITAATTDTVRRALASQKVTPGDTARHFADLLTGTVLVRETMSPGHRVQGLLRGRGGRGSLIADSHPDGLTRGLVQLKDEGEFVIGTGSMLQMMRSMAHGRVHRSVVQPPAQGDVSTALMTYMQVSEQIVSVIATGAHWDGEELTFAGGYVVQLLPGASRGPLMIMTERLEAMPSIDRMLASLQGSAHMLLEELLYQMPYAQLDDRPVSFGCKCSQQTVVATLATLSRDDLAEMITEQEVIELTCDYCKTDYRVASAQLRGLLATS